jgi:Gpi18-like mannosyltransferase
LLIPLLFSLWRVFDFLIIFFSQKIIPYLGFFPYQDQLAGFNLPTWISSLANFDGLHYVLIAKSGYAQYEQAFFPLYPSLIKFLTPLFSNNQLLTGIVISNICFLLGLWFFAKYLELGNKKLKIWPLIFLIAFPTSFFFGAVYTEGLFFLFLTGTLYFLKKENYFLVIILAFLASLTRLIGVFLLIPIIFDLIKTRVNFKKILVVLAPILGLLAYCFYLFKTTGDPFYFITSQPIFGANRSSHLILLPQVYWRYLKIFFIANHDFRYYISVLEFSVFNLFFVVLILDLFKNLKIKNFDRLGLNLFSIAVLILPTLTGTLSSIPRYALFSLSFFIYLSQIKSNVIKYSIVIIFIAVHILLLGFFGQGYFIS